jgi:hypothetical protein
VRYCTLVPVIPVVEPFVCGGIIGFSTSKGCLYQRDTNRWNSLSHWLGVSLVVVSASSVYDGRTYTSERPPCGIQDPTGPEYHIRWYQQLWYATKALRPARYPTLDHGISMVEAFVCGGTIGISMRSTSLDQRETTRRNPVSHWPRVSLVVVSSASVHPNDTITSEKLIVRKTFLIVWT